MRIKSAKIQQINRKPFSSSINHRSNIKTASLVNRRQLKQQQLNSSSSIEFPFNQIQLLRVEPEKIIFQNIQPNIIYKIDLILRNLSTSSKKIRILSPTTKNFRINYQSIPSIASGLALKIVVSFRAKQQNDYFDDLVIFVQDEKKIIPLSALKCKPIIQFEKLPEMNCLKLNQLHQINLKFTNIGVAGWITLRKQATNNFSLSPQYFKLQKNETQVVKISLQPREVGIQRYSVQILVNDIKIQKVLNIIYTAFQYHQFILNEQGFKCKQLKFYNLYYGEQQYIKCKLFNNTPNKTDFKIKVQSGNHQINENFMRHQTPQEIGKQQTEKIIDVQPIKGAINQFQSQQLTIRCKPEISEEHRSKVIKYAKSTLKNNSSNVRAINTINKYKIQLEEFDYTIIAQLNESTLYCNINGFCTLPTVKLSQIQLDFNVVTISQRYSKILYIQNMSKQLPVQIMFPKISGIDIKPNKNILQPCSKFPYDVSFYSNSLGSYCRDQQVILVNLYSVPFKIKAHVVNSKEGTQKTMEPKNINLQYNLNKINKQNYNRILSAQRVKRLSLQRAKSSQQLLKKHLKFMVAATEQDSAANIQKNLSKKNEDDKCPQVDLFFDSKLNPVCSSSNILTLPTEKESLFVIRPIDKYQPYKKSVTYKKKLKDEDYINIKRNQPKNQKQANEIKMELTGQMLKSIKTNTSLINFGKLFINSVAKHPFYIINELISSIQVRLESDNPDLSLIDKNKQIIGSTQRARFDIILKTSTLGEFKIPIKYIINQIHTFELLIFADVELVNLAISKNIVKMAFTQQNQNMEIIQTVLLKNNGNSPASFSVQNTKKCIFIPNVGTIKQKSEEALTIKFRPIFSSLLTAGQPKNLKDFPKSSYNISDQRITIKVSDGLDIPLRIQSNIPQVKCYIKEVEINFGKVMICKQISKTFTIKNTSRISAVFQIDLSQVGEYCKVDIIKGKIPPEGSKDIIVKFKSERQYQLKSKLIINIRASSSIQLPLIGKSVIPNILIMEPNFNFGSITALSTAILNMTLWNKSDMEVELLIDLNANVVGVQYLQIQQINKDDKPQSLSSIESRKQINSSKKHMILIEQNTKKYFRLKYTPAIVKHYNFQLPIFLNDYIKTKTITRIVNCQATEAMFLVEPTNIKFKKKIIIQAQKSIPSLEFINLKNPHNKPINWKFGDEIKTSKIFFIRPLQGILQAEKQLKVKVSFAPTDKGLFKLKLPIYIFDDEKGDFIKYSEISLEGEGDQPKLFFDKKQVILPPVPLEIESKAIFKIFNEGYQNMTIKHRLDIGEQSNIQIGLHFPEGTKVGINKTEIIVLVTFMSKKSISFLTKIQILDSNGKIYAIPVSGTSDNSVLTVFPYLNSSILTYSIQKNQHKIILSQPIEGTRIEKLINFNLPTKESYQYPREFIKKWLKFMLNDEKISLFPQSIIEKNGDQIFRLLYLLTGGKKQFEKSNLLQSPLEIYTFLLKTLKIYGCLLNHIRPYYLLNQNQYQVELKNESYIKNKISPTTKYWYVSYESWIILFYQIIQNFGYQVRSKSINQKLTTQTSSGKQTPLQKQIISNLYSNAEINILRWVEYIWEQYNQNNKKKFINFKKDFCDGVALIYIVYHYIPNKNKQLEGIYKNPLSSNEVLSNLKKVGALISQLGLSIFINEDEILKFTEKQYLLFLMYLYNTLPHYIPKSTPLIFSCHLGDEITKYIDIYNPSHKSISYWVKIQGSNDFKIEEKECIKIQPKKTFKFKVSFVSRISQSIHAYLILTNKRDTTVAGAALVFELKSQILGRKSVKKIEPIKSALYEITSVRVNVQNKFEQFDYGDFQILLIEERQQDKKVVNLNPKSKKLPERSDASSFFCDVQRIKLKKMSGGVIDISFLPLTMEPLKCYIVFIDTVVGQFQYQIRGIPQLPKPLLQIRPQNTIYVDQKEIIELNIPIQNSYMIKAKALMQQKATKAKDYLLYNQNQGRVNNPSDSTQFNIQLNVKESLSKFIKIPNMIQLFTSKRNNFEQTDTNVLNKLKVQICFEFQIKDFVLDMILTNESKTDVRRFKVYLNILPKPLKLYLELRSPARNSVIQNIPINNNSDKDWRFRVNLISEKSQFALKVNEKINLKEITCKKGSQIILPISFTPNWICQVQARLIISNLVTNQLVQYQIKGIGEEPLSENHMHIKCKLKTIQQINISIFNPFQTAHTFKVQTDLVNCYGAPSIYLSSLKKSIYNLAINPLISGTYTGALMFYDQTGRYFWYTLTIQTEDQTVDSVVELTTYIRKPVEVDLQIFNSLDESAHFQVEIRGDDLFGDNKLQIASKSSSLYTLIFKPQKIYQSMGRISFINEKLGQKIYDLKLISKEENFQKLPLFKCQLGSTYEYKIQITNPLNKYLCLENTLSNNVFKLESKSLQPYESTYFTIIYQPLTIGIQDYCELEIFSELFGKLRYSLCGIGQYPVKINSISVDSKLDESKTGFIHFKNPFDYNLTVNVSLTSQVGNGFSLIKGQKYKLTILSNAKMEIPYLFKPKEVLNYQSIVYISINQKTTWRYALNGFVVIQNKKQSITYSTPCRTQLIKYLEVNFEDIKKFIQNNQSFSYQTNYPSNYESLLKNCFDIRLSNPILQDSNDPLRFMINFKPLKPFKTSFDLNIVRKLGGILKIKINLESLKPQVEDIIQIEAKANKPSSVSFAVQNNSNQFKKFNAYIEYPNNTNNTNFFQVIPKSGSLVPAKYPEQTKITIIFNPAQTFKAIHTAKLIIDTHDYFWSYQIKGILPSYKIPQVESKIDNKRDNDSLNKSTHNKKKNFLLQNLQIFKSLKPLQDIKI